MFFFSIYFILFHLISLQTRRRVEIKSNQINVARAIYFFIFYLTSDGLMALACFSTCVDNAELENYRPQTVVRAINLGSLLGGTAGLGTTILLFSKVGPYAVKQGDLRRHFAFRLKVTVLFLY